MYYGLNSDGDRINIDDTIEGEEYTCPCCGTPLVQKKGKINIHHFAHKSRINCDDWYENNKGEWHRWWQSQFPAKYQEVRVEKDGVYHIADCKVDGKIFEFQHSPMSREEFNERTMFYSCDDILYWIFDYRDKDMKVHYFTDYKADAKGVKMVRLNWSHPCKTIDPQTIEVAIEGFWMPGGRWVDTVHTTLADRTVFIEFSEFLGLNPQFCEITHFADGLNEIIGKLYTKEQMIRGIQRVVEEAKKETAIKYSPHTDLPANLVLLT